MRRKPLPVTSYKMTSTRLHLFKAYIWMRYPVTLDDINARVCSNGGQQLLINPSAHVHNLLLIEV